jgi:hypothetical protein
MRNLGMLGAVAGVVAGLTTGCATRAEQQAEDGLQAFQTCDLRSAAQDFANAHDLDPGRADFALAYALSTIAVLPEDPNVTNVLERLGFTRGIDTSALWGSGGVFDRLAAKNFSCTSIGDELRAAIPYAPAQTDGPSAESVLKDTALTGDDFVKAAVALLPRLEKLVSALEQGVDAMGEVDIQGGCGVGAVHVQAPELYALASAVEWLVATIQAASAYDWGLSAVAFLDISNHQHQYVDDLNAHLFHLRNAAALSGAQDSALLSAIHATALLQKGIAAVPRVKSGQANALFDWAVLPPQVLSDAKTATDGLYAMLTTSGPQPLPFFSPALAMNAVSFFATPVDLTGTTPPIWSIVSLSGGGYSLDSTPDAGDVAAGSRFMPDPLASGAASYSFTLFSGWNGVSSDQWTNTFDPDKRWEGLYGCSD